jgi:hypothetical protein
LQAGRWYILSLEALCESSSGTNSDETLKAYLTVSSSDVEYRDSNFSEGGYNVGINFSKAGVFSRKATIFKMESQSQLSADSRVVSLNIKVVSVSGTAKNVALRYLQVEDVTELMTRVLEETSNELSYGYIAGMSFIDFATVSASPYSLGPEDYSINPALLTKNTINTNDSTGTFVEGTEEVTLPNGQKATAHKLDFTNHTGTPSTAYYREMVALSNPSQTLSLDKTYTMSFWAKGSPASVANVAVYMAKAYCIDGDDKIRYQGVQCPDLSTVGNYWKVDSATWKFYRITFTPKALSSGESEYSFFLRNYGGALQIANFKLEEGGRATEYNDNVSIKELLATGIDIKNGLIVATANKFEIQDNQGNKTFGVVNGNLVAYNNATILGNLILSGLLLREPTEITNETLQNYVYASGEAPYQSSWPLFEFVKTGVNIKYSGTQVVAAWLPSIHAGLHLENWNQHHEIARKFVGTRVIIRNTSSVSTIPIHAQGLLLQAGTDIQTALTNTEFSYQEQIYKGEFIELECKHVSFSSDATGLTSFGRGTKEVIYWEFSKGTSYPSS